MPDFYVDSGEQEVMLEQQAFYQLNHFPGAQKRDSCRCMHFNGLGIILSCLGGGGYTVNPSVLITANPALWQESRMETEAVVQKRCYATQFED